MNLIQTGAVNEEQYTIKLPQKYGSACIAADGDIKLLSDEEAIFTLTKNTGTSYGIKNSYSLPDSIYQKARNMYYTYSGTGISINESDSLIKTAEKERNGTGSKTMLRFGYDSRTQNTAILCAFLCPDKKVFNKNGNINTVYIRRRPMFLLTIDSNYSVQQLSLFSTREIIENNGTIAATLGAFITNDTLVTAEVIKQGDQARELPLYATYTNHGGRYIQASSSTMKYSPQHNLAIN